MGFADIKYDTMGNPIATYGSGTSGKSLIEGEFTLSEARRSGYDEYLECRFACTPTRARFRSRSSPPGRVGTEFAARPSDQSRRYLLFSCVSNTGRPPVRSR